MKSEPGNHQTTKQTYQIMKKRYPAIQVKRKSGSEPFHKNGVPIGFDVLSFWGWAASNLANNNLRGHLAEFLVARELGVDQGTRIEWDSCDIRTASGIKIEIKSASYIQAWEQEKISRISFDIAPTRKWNRSLGRREDQASRDSHVFVFCLISEQNQDRFDPMDLSQWNFFVLQTEKLNKALASQRQLSLKKLKQLNPIECTYGNIANSISMELERPL